MSEEVELSVNGCERESFLLLFAPLYARLFTKITWFVVEFEKKQGFFSVYPILTTPKASLKHSIITINTNIEIIIYVGL